MTSWKYIALEQLNGIWAVASLALLIICSFYIQHEARARQQKWQRGWRKFMTPGMRTAVGVGAISLGCFMRAVAVYIWYVTGGHTDLSLGWVMVGTLIAVTGFVCSVREFSVPIYGDKPWLMTVAAIVVFVCADLTAHLI